MVLKVVLNYYDSDIKNNDVINCNIPQTIFNAIKDQYL